jgi:Cyclic nucleotide-binding domain/Major Facilitator Superfamily
VRTVVAVLASVARNRALRRAQFAYAAFNSAEVATWLAMLVYAYSRGGVTESGIVAAALLVPSAVFAPLAAAAGERFAPGRALLAGYALQAATCAAVAAALLAGAAPAVVYALLVGPSVAFTLTRPTQAAFFPGLARTPRELAAANVASGWVEGISVLAGPLITGAILALSSPGMVFAVMAAFAVAGAIAVTPLRDAVSAAGTDPQDDDRSPIGRGIAMLRRDPHARSLVVLLSSLCIALGALDVLYVELARGVLHLGGDWAGYLAGATGVGGVLSVVVTARLVGRARLAVPLIAALIVWSVAFIGLAVRSSVAGAVIFLIVAGGAEKTFDVTGRTLLQRVARPGLMSRVFGLLEGLEMVGYAVGSLLAPALVAVGGADAALIGVGAILPAIALLLGRRLLDIDRHATIPVVEIELLRSMAMFAPLAPATLETLARALVQVTVAAGVEVIVQGDAGDRFFVIADGEADVIASGRHVARLSRGAGFGEIALMYDVPRTATVAARTDLHLYSLDREPFLLALTGQATVARSAHELARARLDELGALGVIGPEVSS